MSQDASVTVRFHPPPEDLRRFFTTFYLTTIDLPPGTEVNDALQPEWAGLRFFAGARPEAWIDPERRLSGARFVATGPTMRSVKFRLGKTRIWGVGLLPLGWARFMPVAAADHANLIADGERHPAFAHLAPLAERLCSGTPDIAGELAAIGAFFRALPDHTSIDEARIMAIHGAVVDPGVNTVAELVERIGTSQRTIERTCASAFGFSPKQLLRRQRFMRSLTQFMLDPTLKWISAIDSHYHDQAQFVRDFHEFMDTTPREYAAQPHPVLEKFMHERARVVGAAVQTLDRPDGVPPAPPEGV